MHSCRLCLFSCKTFNINIQLFNHLPKTKNRLTCSLLQPHLSEGKEVFPAVRTAKGLLLSAVGGLVLAELIRGGEALVTLVASEDCISLKNDEQKIG